MYIYRKAALVAVLIISTLLPASCKPLSNEAVEISTRKPMKTGASVASAPSTTNIAYATARPNAQAQPLNQARAKSSAQTQNSVLAQPNPPSASPDFDIERALQPVKYLSVSIGKRFAGTENERKSAIYIKKEMDSLGLATSLQVFKLPNKTLSYNVVATLPATNNVSGSNAINSNANTKTRTIILGAHYDSKVGPGANDNGSGVGALIELARLAKLQQNRPNVFRFVFFGSEERVGSNPNSHHFGSRYYVNHMSIAEKKATLKMICIDMIANGKVLTVRSLKKKPDWLSQAFLNEAKSLNIPNIYKQAGDDSDFEAFERAGISSTWLEWRPGYNWHTPKDTYDCLDKKCFGYTGTLLQKHLFENK